MDGGGQQLERLLRRAGRLALGVSVLGVVAAAAAVLLLVALAALAVDALFALDSWALIMVDLGILALVAVGAGLAVREAWRNRFDPRRVARRIEERLGIADSRLINAVEFALQPAAAGHARPLGASAALIERSVAKGAALAGGISPRSTMDYRPLKKALGGACLALFIVLAAWLAAPRVFAMVLPRYLDPSGDHPPFTLVDFDIQITPRPLYHGQPATINVELSGGGPVEQANVVFVDGGRGQLEERRSAAMLRKADSTFVLPIERLVESSEFYIDTPQGRSRRHTLAVLRVPRIESAVVSYEFPSYTQWPQSTHTLDARGIRAIAGTKVTVTAKSNLPLRSGLLELTGDDKSRTARRVRLRPSKGDPAVASGSFRLKRGGRYRLSLVGAEGAPSLDVLAGDVVAAPDRPPQVAIIEPAPRLAAVENWKIPVTIQASDDVAIERLALRAGVNGLAPGLLEITQSRPERNTGRANYEFDLGALGARAGDVISYFASAYDNHPGGGQSADTPLFVIQVISQEEYLQFARTQYRMDQIMEELAGFQEQLEGLKAKREKLVKELDQLKDKLAKGEPLTEEEQASLAELEKQLKSYARESQQLAQQAKDRAEQPQLYEFEQPFQDMLKKLSKDLAAQSAAAQEAQSKMSSLREQPSAAGRKQDLQDALQRFAEQEKPFDKSGQERLDDAERDMELMKMADDLLAQADRLKEVIRAQRDLSDRMAEFQQQDKIGPDEQKRAQRMAKEQESLRQELEEATRDLAAAAEKAKDRLPKTAGDAQKLCEKIGEMQIAQDQASAARQARKGAGREASQAAESAAEKLESLLSQCPGGQGMAGEMCKDPGLGLSESSLKEALDQLSQGRGIPGLGQQGKSGSGFSGSDAKITVVGPHVPQGNKSDARSGRMGGKGKGGLAAGTENEAQAAETLNPTAREGSASSAGNVRGVPAGYRAEAEAYFKRLAEEN